MVNIQFFFVAEMCFVLGNLRKETFSVCNEGKDAQRRCNTGLHQCFISSEITTIEAIECNETECCQDFTVLICLTKFKELSNCYGSVVCQFFNNNLGIFLL